MTVSRERQAMLGIWSLAALSCVLGVLARPSLGYHSGSAEQLLDLLRVVCATSLSATLLLGPGLLWRAAGNARAPSLGFLPLPGLAALVGSGTLAWVLANTIEPRLACFIVFAPLLGLLLGGLVAAGPEDLLDREEQRVLAIVGCALGFAIARALWSLGPEGELYSGGISRTLEVGNRSDSRISFIIPQLVAHGSRPYGPMAGSLFAPYNFSSRGPFAGLASAPIVLMSGGRPPAGLPEMRWLPFDPQGFMAYRLAMMTFATTAFVSLWDLTARLGGRQAARVALLLAVTTPFLVHEVWFTWPKLLGASMVLLAGVCVVERRPFRAGVLAGVGYLMHPGGLLALSSLGLLALWPLKGASWKRPHLKAGVLLGIGVAISLVGWRLLNGSHYDQSGFAEYLLTAGAEAHPSPLHWIAYRAESLGNTFVPMLLPLFFAHSVWINSVEGTSPPVIHFFFQYWDGLPFGVGILFFPLLLISLARAWRRWPWPVFASVVVPLLAFVVYWGASQTGILREGLQAWVLILFAVVALQQARSGFPWLRSKAIRAILSLRTIELLAVALVPTLATSHVLVSSRFAITDTLAVIGMLGFACCLALAVWSAVPARLAEAEPGGRSRRRPAH